MSVSVDNYVYNVNKRHKNQSFFVLKKVSDLLKNPLKSTFLTVTACPFVFLDKKSFT